MFGGYHHQWQLHQWTDQETNKLEQSSNGKLDKNHGSSNQQKVKLLQTAVCPAVLCGCEGEQIEERWMIPWTVGRMSGATNQIVHKQSLETFATISKMEIFWKTTRSSDSMKKYFML
jgi:hypothetical protein